MPYAQDGSFTYEMMISRVNSDLANVLGNLVNRTVAMVQKYFDGVIQKPGVTLTEEDKALDADLINLAAETVKNVEAKMNEYKIHLVPNNNKQNGTRHYCLYAFN